MNKPRSGHFQGKRRYGLALFIGLLVCANNVLADEAKPVYHFNKLDPYEQINRKIYTFNDAVDDYVGKPISDAYRWVMPQFVQTRIFNFFNNLKGINVVINDVLQAKFKRSAQDTGRFAVNSTVGLGGLFDVAEKIGWEQGEEDFDQTLAVWGVHTGPYLVIPILGPFTVRGIPGTVFDTAANPSTYIGVVSDINAPIQLVSMLNTRANAEGSLKFINEAALDPYVFMRDSFLQWRNNLAKDGNVSAEIDEYEQEADNSSAIHHLDFKGFKDAAHTFGDTSSSFAETARAFSKVNENIEQLKQQSSHKKPKTKKLN
ncbi:MAG: VacJ family lipoprotein [Methylococcaceae bacterium]